jgi:hypothetical protein
MEDVILKNSKVIHLFQIPALPLTSSVSLFKLLGSYLCLSFLIYVVMSYVGKYI